MADTDRPPFGCILTEDIEDQLMRQCHATLYLGCPCETGCPHGSTLACWHDDGHDGPHRDIDGIEWNEAADA